MLQPQLMALCWCCHLAVRFKTLVSAHRLWKDLQTFCCSQEKCNFHNNSNLNCTLKVRGVAAPKHVPCAGVWEHGPPRTLEHPAESQPLPAACCRWRR